MGWFWVGLIAAAVWLFRAYFMPFANCGRCKGKKTNHATRLFGSKKRFGPCKRCGGTGSRQVLGSKQVHRAVKSARNGWSNSRKAK